MKDMKNMKRRFIYHTYFQLIPQEGIEMIEMSDLKLGIEEENNSSMLAVERLLNLSGGIMRAEISDVFRTIEEINSLISAISTGLVCHDDARLWIQPGLCFVMMAGVE